MFWQTTFHLFLFRKILYVSYTPIWIVIVWLIFHLEGVIHLLCNIQAHKASGPDNLPAHFLKEMANKIAPVLIIIFQASLDQGSLSAIWKIVAVVPIFKKGKKIDPCNYRPISLICICKFIPVYHNIWIIYLYVMNSMVFTRRGAVRHN